MGQVIEKQMPAGGPAFDDGFALASEVEIVEDFKMHDTFTLKNSQEAKLAAVDALLTVIERTPVGFRSLRRQENTPIATPWPQYIVDIAMFSGVDAVVFRRGAFLIDERVLVCHQDELGRGIQTGWSCVKLPCIDGKVRADVASVPRVLVSPDARVFIWQPHGDLRKQRRLTFGELCELLGEMGLRLAQLGGAAA